MHTNVAVVLVVTLLAGMASSTTAVFFDPNMKVPNVPGAHVSQAQQCSEPPQPLPKIKSDKLCQTSGFSNSTGLAGKCLVLGLAEQTLFGQSEATGPVCNAALQSPATIKDQNGRPLPYPLLDGRPLEPVIPNVVVDWEGGSLYWLYRTLQNFALWAPCAATNETRTVTAGTPVTGDTLRDWHVPPEWTVYSTLWQPDGNADAGYFRPFATVIYKHQQVVILIRGTQTQQNWLSDFDYSLASSGPLLPLPGTVHRGFAAIATSLWPGIANALHNLWKENGIKNVYVAGHSLGAGVATMISFAAQEYLDDLTGGHGRYGTYDKESAATADTGAHISGYEHYSRHHVIKVDAALFAPPDAGDATFVEAFGERVNARHISFLYDIVPQIPCSPMIGCTKTGGFGSVVVGTNTTANGGMWPYAPLPGEVALLPKNMPANQHQWGLFQNLYACQLGRFAEATHICSYLCYFTKYVDDSNNMCRLWNTTTSTGSYCFTYPVTDGAQYPFDSSS